MMIDFELCENVYLLRTEQDPPGPVNAEPRVARLLETLLTLDGSRTIKKGKALVKFSSDGQKKVRRHLDRV